MDEWSLQTVSPTQELLPAVLTFKLDNRAFSLLATINTSLFVGFWERIDHSLNTEIAVFDYNGNKFLSYRDQPLASNIVFDAVEDKIQTSRIGQFFLSNQRVTIYSQTLLEGVTAHVMISRSDSDGNIIDVNKPFLDVMGYTQQELKGQSQRMFANGLKPPSGYEQLGETIQAGKI